MNTKLVAVRETIVAVVPPNVTAETSDNADPVTVTDVPPNVEPVVGVTVVSVGGARKVNADVATADPAAFVRTMSTIPGACAGAVMVIDAAFFVMTVAEIDPTVTEETFERF